MRTVAANASERKGFYPDWMKSPYTPIHTIECFKDQEFYDWLVVFRNCCHVICYLRISLLDNKLENVQMCIFFTHNKEDAML